VEKVVGLGESILHKKSKALMLQDAFPCPLIQLPMLQSKGLVERGKDAGLREYIFIHPN
jgi:hypothetical protein